MKFILRLIVVALILAGIGYLVYQYADIKGSPKNLADKFSNNYNLTSVKIIEDSTYILSVKNGNIKFADNSQLFGELIISVKTNLDKIVLKNCLLVKQQWVLEKDLNKIMNLENDELDYMQTIKDAIDNPSITPTVIDEMMTISANGIDTLNKAWAEFNVELEKVLAD